MREKHATNVSNHKYPQKLTLSVKVCNVSNHKFPQKLTLNGKAWKRCTGIAEHKIIGEQYLIYANEKTFLAMRFSC